jgi:transglutaminase-like putative cysteine protease
LRGADVSHAWASLWVPGGGWVDIDPTNSQVVDDRYVTAAWGRDYADIPPLKGVIFTKGREHELDVVVDVVRLDDSG